MLDSRTLRRSLLAVSLLAAAACGDDAEPRPAPERASPPPGEPPRAPPEPATDPVPARRAELALGGAHSCVLAPDGRVRCWGSHQYGQLGTASIAPGPGARSAAPVVVDDVLDAVRIEGGHFHSCAVRADGGVSCWGHGGFGQLGTGATEDRNRPVRVALPEPAIELALGEGHTCARLASRRVACWGRNDFGQLGDGTRESRSTPTIVAELAGVAAIGAGRDHACALLRDGTVACWGAGYEGQLGTGGRTDGHDRPAAVPGLRDVRAIAIGSAHGCALDEGGAVACWGRNDGRQIGNGGGGEPADVVRAPLRVSGVDNVTALAAGARHTCARLAGGAIRCWGYNGFGQLGDGSDEEREGSVEVTGVAGATSIDLGVRHGCARVDPGAALAEGAEGPRTTTHAAIFCWGRNHEGQLGDGTTEARHAPVRVQL
jgi:alpha-tubulin suppressor-like RCC1 family protein